MKLYPLRMIYEIFGLDDLLEAKKWMVHSYQVCESFKSKEKFSVSDYDALESFFLVSPEFVICSFDRFFGPLTHMSLSLRGVYWMY